MTQSPADAATETRALWRDCVFIALASLVPVVILRPFQNTPFVDDWMYAWSVENLLDTGRLQVLDYSSSVDLAQIIWGWLFCLPFGFSFTALRVSTWVLSVVCLCGLYLTLREFSVPRRESLLGTATLGVYPVYFLLAFTFMTDVPFLAAVVWSMLCLVKAVHRHSDRWLVAAALLACVAASVRVMGVVLPGVFLATLLFHMGPWGRRPGRLLVACLPAFYAVGMTWAYSGLVAHFGDTTLIGGSTINRTQNLFRGLVFVPELYVMNIGLTAGSLGLALAPLAVGIISSVPRKRVIRIAAMLLILLIGQIAVGMTVYHALHQEFFWNPHELGLAERLTPHFQTWGPVAAWVWVVHVAALGLFAALVTAAGRAGGGVGSKALGWQFGGSFVLMTVVWAVYDRYLLLLVPALIVLALTNRKLARPRLVVALLAVFGVLSFVGVRDHLAFNTALWKAVAFFEDEGLPTNEMHGGYVINGWLLYTHPGNAKLDENGLVLVPGLTTDDQTRYEISNHPTPGTRVLFETPYQRWLGRSGSVYVLDLKGG